MIKLYKNNETDFSHNGLCILKDCIKAEIREEINGNFTLDLEYPLNSELANDLVRGNIIKCVVADTREEQLFRIRRILKNLRTVNIYAEHITIADLGTNFIVDTNIIGKNRLEALQQILDKALEKHNFKSTGDTGGKQDILRIVRYSPLKAIIGTEENTLISRYGGEIEFDNFNIKVLNQRGRDNGVLISYGKNITGIEEIVDDTELTTCIIPQGANELLLPEYCIKSKYINNYEKIYFKHVKLDNIGIVEKSEDNPGVTREEACNKLRQAVEHLYNIEMVDITSCNYRINFVELSKTEEYRDYAVLEKVAIGDTVTIRHSKMNIDIQARVINYSYDALLDKYIEIELGFKKKDLTGIIQDTQKQIQFTKEKIEMGISNLDNTLSSKITITENGIKEEIKNTEEGLQTSIDKTAEGINANVKNLRDNTNSQIQVLSDNIAFKVGKGEVISAINMSPESITIDSRKLNITGFVTVGDLINGYTTINGNCIRSGTISGIHLQGVQIDGSVFRSGDVTCQQLHVLGFADLQQGCSIGGDLNARYLGSYGNIAAQGNLTVSGTKNCIQNTKHYGKRLINAYETAEIYYGDLGFGTIKDGVFIVKIDVILRECFNTDIPYHVFTQTYNGTNLKINKYPSYIVFKGEEGTEFSWEIKAKRLGYESTRLEEKIMK